MTTVELLLTIAIVAFVTLATRAISFILFPGGKKPPKFVTWMGRQLPRAVMAMLVIYCLKDISFSASPWGIPALVAVAVTAALHVWKKQMVLSICGGTLMYMLLIRLLP